MPPPRPNDAPEFPGFANVFESLGIAEFPADEDPRAALDRFAGAEAARLIKEKGKVFFVLAEDGASPSVRLIRKHIKAKLPQASWHVYEPTDSGEAKRGAEIAFGAKLAVRYRFEKADR